MSMLLEDADVAAIAVLLSRERLAALTRLTGSIRTAVDLHQATLSIGANLMTIIASIEIALRNSVGENLTLYFGTPGWLIRPAIPFQWKIIEKGLVQKALDAAQRAEYAEMSHAEKVALDVEAFPQGGSPGPSHPERSVLRRQQISVSNGSVIAETTFYFWKRLYSTDYEQALWRTTLKKTFPNKSLRRAQVAEKLEDIYKSRNRLAHHEPVLHKRFHATIAAIEFVVENLGAVTPAMDRPLAKLVACDLKAIKDKAKVLHDRLAAFRAA